MESGGMSIAMPKSFEKGLGSKSLRKTRRRKFFKVAVDVLMFADFLFLMCHEVVRDLEFHGILGAGLFALFLFHHALNGKFWKSVGKGRYTAGRALLVSTDGILFLLMLAMAFSSVMMSGAVFSFSPVRMTSWSRPLHTFSCSWGFLVMNFHLGLHLHARMKKWEGEWRFLRALWPILFALAVFGIFQSELYVYLFWMNAWKASAASLWVCLLELLAIAAGMICLAHGALSLLDCRRLRKKSLKLG